MSDVETELRLLRQAVTDPVARFVLADWLAEHGRDEEAAACRSAGLVRKVDLDAAWDRRHKDPNKDYGVHGVNLRMAVCGPRGAISFVLYTGWHLPDVLQGWEGHAGVTREVLATLLRPLPADLGWHSLSPRGHYSKMDDCPYLGGRACWYSGTSLGAQDAFDVLVKQGGERLWAYLEESYREAFEK